METDSSLSIFITVQLVFEIN